MPKTIKRLDMDLIAKHITFDSICDECESPSLIGKIIVNVVGFAGAGNGRCLLSPTLPRFGAMVEDVYVVQGYQVTLIEDELRVGMLIGKKVTRLSQDNNLITLLNGPSLRLTDQSRNYISTLKIRPDPLHYIQKLYKNHSYTDDGLITMRNDLGKFSYRGGVVVFVPEGWYYNASF